MKNNKFINKLKLASFAILLVVFCASPALATIIELSCLDANLPANPIKNSAGGKLEVGKTVQVIQVYVAKDTAAPTIAVPKANGDPAETNASVVGTYYIGNYNGIPTYGAGNIRQTGIVVPTSPTGEKDYYYYIRAWEGEVGKSKYGQPLSMTKATGISTVYKPTTFQTDKPAPGADTTPPTSSVTITADLYGPLTWVNADTIKGTAVDDKGVSYVDITIQRNSNNYYWNGDTSTWQAAEKWNKATGTTAWTYNLNSANMGNGIKYTVRSRATDTANNPQVTPFGTDSFTWDNVSPQISIGNPSVNLINNGTVTYTVTYSGANTITLAAGKITLNKTVTANGSVAAVSGTGSSRTVTINNITGNGSLGISIAAGTASDTAGNLAPAAGPSSTFTVDNTAPSVPTAVTFTAVGGTVNANSLNATNTNFTAGATIVAGQATGGKAELLKDGQSFTNPIMDNSIGVVDPSVAFNPGFTSNAQVQAAFAASATLSVKLTDAAGNFSISSVNNPSITVNYNTAPLSPSSLGPTQCVGGGWITDNTPTLEFTLDDPDLNDTLQYQIQISKVNIYNDASIIVDYTSPLTYAKGKATFTVGQPANGGTYLKNVATLPDHPVPGQGFLGYYWKVKAIDKAGASSDWTKAKLGNMAFKVDATPPAFASGITGPASPTTNTSLTFEWSDATDSVSGMEGTYDYYYLLDHNPTTDPGTTNGTNDKSKTFSDTALETWYLHVAAQDTAGNRTVQHSSQIEVVANTAPTVPIIGQYKADGTTSIPIEGWLNKNDVNKVICKFKVSDADGNQPITPSVQYKKRSRTADNTWTAWSDWSSWIEGAKVSPPYNTDAQVEIPDLPNTAIIEDQYEWHAKANDGAADSAIVEFNATFAATNQSDFRIDTIAPILKTTDSFWCNPTDEEPNVAVDFYPLKIRFYIDEIKKETLKYTFSDPTIDGEFQALYDGTKNSGYKFAQSLDVKGVGKFSELKLYHKTNFQKETTYTLTFNFAEDLAGNPLAGDNDIKFTTVPWSTPIISSLVWNEYGDNKIKKGYIYGAIDIKGSYFSTLINSGNPDAGGKGDTDLFNVTLWLGNESEKLDDLASGTPGDQIYWWESGTPGTVTFGVPRKIGNTYLVANTSVKVKITAHGHTNVEEDKTFIVKPTLYGLEPNSGYVGQPDPVKITGNAFGTDPNKIEVQFTGAPAKVKALAAPADKVPVQDINNDYFYVNIPQGTTTGVVQVFVDGQPSNTINLNKDDPNYLQNIVFTIDPAPTVASIAPVSGMQGDTVPATIAGTSFKLDGITLVKLVKDGQPDIDATSIKVLGTTTLTCNLPVSLYTQPGDWKVKIINPDGQSVIGSTFTVNLAVPTLSSITPASATQGDSIPVVKIYGSKFKNKSGDLLVRLTMADQTPIPATKVYSNDSDTVFTCDFGVPEDAATGDWKVEVANADNPDNYGSNPQVIFNIKEISAPTVDTITWMQDGKQDYTWGSIKITSKKINDKYTFGKPETGTVNFNLGAWKEVDVKDTQNPLAAKITYWADDGSEIQVLVGRQMRDGTYLAAGDIKVMVSSADTGKSSSGNDSFMLNPTLFGLDPNHGYVGQAALIKITGFAFGTTPNNIEVQFTGAPQKVKAFAEPAPTQGTDNDCFYTYVPSGTQTGAVQVFVNGKPSNIKDPATQKDIIFTIDPAPAISSLDKTSAEQGDEVTIKITGSNFILNNTKAILFRIGGQPQQIDAKSNSVISQNTMNATFAIPLTATPTGAWNLTVKNLDGQSVTKLDAFTINLAVPTITSVDPTFGTQGKPVDVTIWGSKFKKVPDQVAENPTIKLTKLGQDPIVINNLPNSTITVWDNGQIKCSFTIPENADTNGTWNVEVANADNPANPGSKADAFTINKPSAPAIQNIYKKGTAEEWIYIYDSIEIKGSNFGAQVDAEIKLDNLVIPTGDNTYVKSWQDGANNDAKVEIYIPDKIGADYPVAKIITLTLKTKGGETTHTFDIHPTLYGFDPPTGKVNDPVKVTGLAFGTDPLKVTVEFAGAGNVATSANNTEAAAPVPPGAQTGKIKVVVNDMPSNLSDGDFTIIAPPTVSSIDKLSAQQGDQNVVINITGKDFKSGAKARLYHKDGNPTKEIPASTKVIDATKIEATFNLLLTVSPTGSDNKWAVEVVNPDTQLGKLDSVFTIDLAVPTINDDGISPKSGTQGKPVDVTIWGSKFKDAPQKPIVKLTKDNQEIVADAATVGVFENNSKITCTFNLPADAATGPWNVVVINADNPANPGSKADAFTVTSGTPSITSVTDSAGVSQSKYYLGQTIKIKGQNFGVYDPQVSKIYFEDAQKNKAEGKPTDWRTSPQEITIVIVAIPGSAGGTVNVTVKNANGESVAYPITVDTSKIYIDDFEKGAVDSWKLDYDGDQKADSGYYVFQDVQDITPNAEDIKNNNNLCQADAVKEGTLGAKVKYSFIGTDGSDWGGGWGAKLANPLDLETPGVNVIQFYLHGDGTANTLRLDFMDADGTIVSYEPNDISLSQNSWSQQPISIPLNKMVVDQAQSLSDAKGTKPIGDLTFDWKHVSNYNFVYTTKNTSNNYHYIDSIIAEKEAGAAGVPLNLMAKKSGNDIVLSWDPPSEGEPGVEYRVYRGTKLDAITNLITSKPSGVHTATDPNVVDTPDSYFYVVKSYNGIVESGASNVAFIEKSDLTPKISNLFWISIPYKNNYTNAQSIVDEINEGKTPGTNGTCAEIGKWKTDKGAYDSLSYLEGLGWMGTNFTVTAGESYYIAIVGTTTWKAIGAHDPNFSFNLSYPNGTNIYWLSLPYNGDYASAQAIVDHINGVNPNAAIEIGRYTSNGVYETLSYLEGLGWMGTNFTFTPGEGYYVSLGKAVSNWKPKVK